MKAGTPSLQRKSLSQQIASDLTQRIMQQEFSLEMALPSQEQLSQEYRVSRPVIREAIRTLEGQELVQSNQGKITQIVRPHPRTLERFFTLLLHEDQNTWMDLINVRRVLEVECARTAARNSNTEDIGRLEEVLHTMDSSRLDHSRYNALDIQFHVTIAEMSKNYFLLHLIESTRGSLMRIITDLRIELPQTSYDVIQDNHQKIFTAIQRGDEEEAASSMLNHFREVMERLTARMPQ